MDKTKDITKLTNNAKMIVAMDDNNGIGLKNNLPWYFPEDLKYFSKTTKGNGNNAIVMGRNTWNSLPKKPLPNRFNIILTRNITEEDRKIEGKYGKNGTTEVKWFDNINTIKTFCNERKFDDVWIIGGESIYKEFIDDEDVTCLYVTRIKGDYNCDTLFPQIPNRFTINNLSEYSNKTTNDNISYELYKMS